MADLSRRVPPMNALPKIPVYAAIVFGLLMNVAAYAAVTAVPLSPDLQKSALYRVHVNGKEIDVYSELSANRAIETAFFQFNGSVDLRIDVRESFRELTVRPLRYGLSANAKISFPQPNHRYIQLKLKTLGHYVIELNGLPPLVLICSAPDANLPNANDPNVIYFGPGVHEPGRIRVRSNQTVFLDAGAKVYGTIEGSCVENVRVTGRGHLYGTKHTDWQKRTYGIVFDRSKNITIEKIGIRDCHWWTTNFVLCDNLTIRDINLLSFNKNSGGLMIDSCPNLVARDSLLMSRDDCIAPHALNAAGNGEVVSDNMLFENLVLYNVVDGNGIRIGASLETSEVCNWTFRNIDVVHRAGAAVFSDHSDWATVRNLMFENVTDEATSLSSINMSIARTRYSCKTGYRDERGRFEGLYFKNYVSCGGKIVLDGFDRKHSFNNVVFAGCKIGDRLVRSADDIEANRFVLDLRFLPNAADLNVTQLKPSQIPTAPARTISEVVIDDSDKQNFRSFGFSQQTEQEGSIGRTASIGKTIGEFGHYAAAIYEPEVVGRYTVYAHWGTHQGLDPHSPWIIKHRHGYTRVYLDQNNNPGWHCLGTFDLDASSNVRLVHPNYFEPTEHPVVADAVKFIRENTAAKPSE
jgi:hypothetical protein